MDAVETRRCSALGIVRAAAAAWIVETNGVSRPADVQVNELPAANDPVSDAVAMSFVQRGQSVMLVGNGQSLSGVAVIACSIRSVAGARRSGSVGLTRLSRCALQCTRRRVHDARCRWNAWCAMMCRRRIRLHH